MFTHNGHEHQGQIKAVKTDFAQELISGTGRHTYSVHKMTDFE